MIKISLMEASEAKDIATLAIPIWQEHYTPIIGSDQVSYMLEKFQSEAAIKQQLAEGYQYFQVFYMDVLTGYFSVQVRQPNRFFISKFYLSEQARGKKIGTAMLAFIEQQAMKNNCTQLDLTVNKFNPAYEIYLKLGFENVGSVEMDIGNGYIMDDYLMRKTL